MPQSRIPLVPIAILFLALLSTNVLWRSRGKVNRTESEFANPNGQFVDHHFAAGERARCVRHLNSHGTALACGCGLNDAV